MFIWGLKLDQRWEIMFYYLKEFKEQKDHCNVLCTKHNNLESVRQVWIQNIKDINQSREHPNLAFLFLAGNRLGNIWIIQN